MANIYHNNVGHSHEIQPSTSSTILDDDSEVSSVLTESEDIDSYKEKNSKFDSYQKVFNFLQIILKIYLNF